MNGEASKDARAGAHAEKSCKKKQNSASKWTQLDRYKRALKTRMEALGVYKPQYGELIERTAKLYVKLDRLEKQMKQLGDEMLVEYTNKAGATNLVLNPCIREIEKTYDGLLVHERELGLTPAAMKKISGEIDARKEESPLVKVLKELKSG